MWHRGVAFGIYQDEGACLLECHNLSDGKYSVSTKSSNNFIKVVKNTNEDISLCSLLHNKET